MTPEDVFNVLDAMPSMDKWIKIEDGSWINFGMVSMVGVSPHNWVELTLEGSKVVLRGGFSTHEEAIEFLDHFMGEMTE